MAILSILLIILIIVGTYIAWWLFSKIPEYSVPVIENFTYLPNISVKESEYIKVKRQECIEKYSNMLLSTNPERRVDLLNPTVLTKHEKY